MAVSSAAPDAFTGTIRPLLESYCIGCHSAENQKGDLDLERFGSMEAVAGDPSVWEHVLEQLELGEMPPAKKKQPSAAEKNDLLRWVRSTLADLAKVHAGDPGPVVLRRLSNAEYAWTLRDLTGVPSLDPAKEFPVDGAAGEGFTNAGAALVMSPALVTKYLDAAKEVANHAVLVPGGIEFSATTTRRDWTEEKLAAIRAIYSRYSVPGDGMALNLQGLKFDTQDGGTLPLEKYFAATLAERGALESGAKDIAAVASESGLSEKYLGTLWEALHGSNPSLPLDPIRKRWREAGPGDALALARAVKQWQLTLWRFNTIGHIGKVNGPKAWQEPVLPFVTAQEIRLKLPADGRQDLTLALMASDAGDGNEGDVLAWENPRLLRGNLPPVPLQHVPLLGKRLEELVAAEPGRTSDYLNALTEALAGGRALEALAAERHLNSRLLGKWSALAGIGRSETPVVAGLFTTRLGDVAGNPAVQGWGSPETPSIIANALEETLRFSTLTVPGRSVMVHPSPSREVAVYWRSPMTGKIRVAGSVADGDGNCGNGVAWRVELIRREGTSGMAVGLIDNGGQEAFGPGEEFSVQDGDLVMFAINPRDSQHVCDTTRIDLSITEAGGGGRAWNLAKEIVDHINEGNPLGDSYGNAGIWHFCASPENPSAAPVLPQGSALAHWRESMSAGKPLAEVQAEALAVQRLMTAPEGAVAEADVALRKILLDIDGPLGWLAIAAADLDAGPRDIEAAAPSLLEFQLPGKLAAGAEFAATARLHVEKGRDGSMQVHAFLKNVVAPADGVPGPIGPHGPILVAESGSARDRIAGEFEEFRNLFPAALCYTKIVPVDEVVTLRLFYREDEQLRRLMLDEKEAADLDRLWADLDFVTLSPLRLVDVFEQLWQYATQDADPSAFEPMREPILRDAARFREALVAAEPRQLEAVLEFAAKAWRRPLAHAESENLRSLYLKLREEKLEHEDAIRLTLARVLTAPAFLYKLEKPGAGEKAVAVSDFEMATRLSYFLWSTAPDAELVELAAAGKLNDPEVLSAQTRRMLGDDRVRRLAIEFGTQWLHTRDFDQLDEKSERTFPGFTAIRGALNEEPIRYFTDLFQRDGSVLELLDADHTFVNDELAGYYGIPGVEGDEWRRVDGIRVKGRGGVLGFGATLAKQSGASRTSPILRGNWVCETLLGEHLPPPPKDVPVLPEQPPAGLSERELTARHSSDPACARCHMRMDPFGFALENFDAVGRFRAQDLLGRPVDASAKASDGAEFSGIDGLRAYLLSQRGDDFERQFCRKFLGYALGRGVRLSDAPLLDKMQEELSKKDHRIGVIAGLIVRSPQFREIRGRAHPSTD